MDNNSSITVLLSGWNIWKKARKQRYVIQKKRAWYSVQLKFSLSSFVLLFYHTVLFIVIFNLNIWSPLLASILLTLHYLCSTCSSFLSLSHLFSFLLPCPPLCPPLPPSTSLPCFFRGSWSTCQASPSPSLFIQPLIRSIHYFIHRDIIRWLCMGPALLLPILGLTHTNTHRHWSSSTDGSWRCISFKNSVDVLRQRNLATQRPPRLICLFASNQCQDRGRRGGRTREGGRNTRGIGEGKRF